MEGSGRSHISAAVVECAWNSAFNKRRQLNVYMQENEPHFRNISRNLGSFGSIVRIFMRDSRKVVQYFNQADKVVAYCDGANLEVLENDHNCSIEQLHQPNSLLDDRKEDIYPKGGLHPSEGDHGQFREPQGPMSPFQLYRQLQKPRYQTTESSTHTREQHTEPDAERRIIYITDPNRWSILVIVATASYHQGSFLRSFIYSYIQGTNSIGVTIPTGFPKFGLEFHLQFYAWRKGPHTTKDPRKNASGRSIRRVHCLNFFDIKSPRSPNGSCVDHLYQVQVSFLVAGLDKFSWVGYCFVDTYHNGKDNDDSVFNLQARAGPPHGFPMEPPSGGNLSANCPLWTPRVYFLRIFESRLEITKNECVNVVSMVEERMSPHTDGVSISEELESMSNSEDRVQHLRRLYGLAHNAKSLLLELINTLSNSIDSWDEFERSELYYFLTESEGQDVDDSIQSIQASRRHINVMKKQLKTLQNQQTLCDSLADKLATYLSLEDTRSIMIQLKTAMIQLRMGKYIEGMAILALLVSPPSIAAAIFSINPVIVPFNPTMFNYSITTAVFGTVIWLILHLLMRWSRKKTNQIFAANSLPLSAGLWSRAGGTFRDLTPRLLRYDTREREEEDTELRYLGEEARATSFL